MEVSKEIGQAVATGEVVIGTAKSLKTIKRGRAKLIIVASNCDRDTLVDVQHYAKLAGVPVHIFSGDSKELGLACGKPFMISVLSIIEPGSSNIISVGERR